MPKGMYDILKDTIIGEDEIVVGGASVNEQFAKSIRTYGYAMEAGSAVELVMKLVTS